MTHRGASHVGIYVGNNMMITVASLSSIPALQVLTGRNILWHLVVCIKGGDRADEHEIKKTSE